MVGAGDGGGGAWPQSVLQTMQIGEVPHGWTRHLWIAELRRMAGCCREMHPELAWLYRGWAWSLEDEHKLHAMRDEQADRDRFAV